MLVDRSTARRAAFVLALCVALTGLPGNASAFKTTFSGPQAQEFRSLLEILPYTAMGQGNVVYVFGRPGCPNTRDFYNIAKGLASEYEFRWVLEPNVNHMGDSLGLTENGPSSNLEKAFSEQAVPANDRETAEVRANTYISVRSRVYDMVKLDSVMLPIIAFETAQGFVYMGYGDDLTSADQVRSLLQASVGYELHAPFDVDAAMARAVVRHTDTDLLCADESPLPVRFLPDDQAPLYQLLEPGECMRLRAGMGDGWVGVRIFSNPNDVYVYSKKSDGVVEE